MISLFDSIAPRPLADRLRPRKLDEVIGQDHLLKGDAPLARMIRAGKLQSLILWGPPGCGKTTIARLLADAVKLHFEPVSAVASGVVELRKVFDGAEKRHAVGQGTLLFVDEIHRFNRAQQDAFLPYVENGTVTLVGATTENPSFELNGALLSRAQVLVLKRLDDNALEALLARAEQEAGHTLALDTAARTALKNMADGDGRYLLTLAEDLLTSPPPQALTIETLTQRVQKRAPLYDKAQDSHYNLISALHKALRGSDVDAALYWYARIMAGGEDPHYIARRLTRFAVEDIGLADPQALTQAIAAWQAFERIGSPEADLALAQLVIYLATAPKSNAAYTAWKGAQAAAHETGSLMPQKHSMNAPTKLMREQGYAEGYDYDHGAEGAFSAQNHFPPEMARVQFYMPSPRGNEVTLAKRLAYWAEKRAEKQNKD